MSDYWSEWAATLTPGRPEFMQPDDDEVTTPVVTSQSPKAPRSGGAAARLVNLLRDGGEHRLTTGDLMSRCGIQKAHLARTMRTTVVQDVMKAEGWSVQRIGRGFEVVRDVESAPPADGYVMEHPGDF